MISDGVREYLASDGGDYVRRNPQQVERALEQLRVAPDSDFGRFYLEFEGPFISPRPVPDLDELVDFGSSIMSSREYFSDRYGLGDNYVPLTSDESEGAFLYDATTGGVFDFSLADYDQFKSGGIAPRWNSFGEFLDWYFEV